MKINNKKNKKIKIDPNLQAQPYGAYPIVLAAKLDSIRILQLLIVAGASMKVHTPLATLQSYAKFHHKFAIAVFIPFYFQAIVVVKKIFGWCRLISTKKPNFAKIQILKMISLVRK